MERIEKHPDFTLTPEALNLVKPEIRESKQFTPAMLEKLQEKLNKPVRDFVWETSGKKTRFSEMDKEFLLVAARHCVHRANIYHQKVCFFMEALSILEEHATEKGLQIPETVEDIQALIEKLQDTDMVKQLSPEPVPVADTPAPATPKPKKKKQRFDFDILTQAVDLSKFRILPPKNK